MSSLLKELLAYSTGGYYPMHMPGHKRNTEVLKGFNPYDIDITEIDGFDNLHHASGILKELVDRIQELYHSETSHLLINGSTVGILAGISACTKKKDRILMARNCHKAVYNAVILGELDPVYIYPQEDGIYGIHGGISAEKVEELLIIYSDIKLVVLTSPTYEGILSDIKSIVQVCHKYKVPVLVDEAHGAHLGFSHEFPSNSIAYGADLVIHSIHKTLPAFTQTAVMHVNGNLVSKVDVERYLGIYETSSPSYLLMAGVDQCMGLLKKDGEKLFHNYTKLLNEFYQSVSNLKHLKVMNSKDYTSEMKKEAAIYAFDPSKILISVKNTNITGSDLSKILLEEYKIQLEMSSLFYGLAMTSICDTKEGLDRLKTALYEIDERLGVIMEKGMNVRGIEGNYILPQKGMIPYDAIHSKTEMVLLENSVGRIAGNHIMIYPPGIPIVAAGEVIGKQHIEELIRSWQSGLEILGLIEVKAEDQTDQSNQSLWVQVVAMSL